MSGDPTMGRLEDQINWYDKRSTSNQNYYKFLKLTVIVLAALIPLLSASSQIPFTQVEVPKILLGALGAAIAVIEGVQQLNQYQANWISYRSTCEALKHEKYLYLAKAGPYAAAADPHALLAERVESLVSQEHAKWASAQTNTEKNAKPPAGAPEAG